MGNARMDDSQAGIEITGRNTNNLRYADANTLMAESEEELKGLLMKVNEDNEEAGLKVNIQVWHSLLCAHKHSIRLYHST